MRFRTRVSYLFTLIIMSVDCRSISNSENVTKRETKKHGDLFPDWVPFKNKHGEELGEFSQVVTKKPKKRLALPLNYLIRAVAEPEPEDYFDKGLGESDGEDYFDKREWSDANRGAGIKPVYSVPPLRHAELSDIDGIVGIITRHNPPPYRTSTTKNDGKVTENKRRKKPKPKKFVEYPDEEDDTEKLQLDLEEKERSANEAKKVLILDSVDELKERHAMEQKSISEKIKEEAMHTEERDRDNAPPEIFDKYSQKSRGRKPEYEEYEDRMLGLDNDKYKITPLKKPSSTNIPSSSTEQTSTVSTTYKTAQTGRLSVFRHPSIYMIYDEESSTESTTEYTSSTSGSSITPSNKYSSKFTTRSSNLRGSANERISLVPQDNELREGEPTLFFPRKTKRKEVNKMKMEKTKSSDSYAAASSQDLFSNSTDAAWPIHEKAPSGPENATDLSGAGATNDPVSSGSGQTGSSELESSQSGSSEYELTGTGPSGTGETASPEVSSGPPLAVDVVPASSDHKEEHKKDQGHEHEKGGETEHHSEHHSEHGEKGKKSYEGVHEDKKTEKAHHDKEDHLGKYHDHGGVDKKHHDEKKHHGSHNHQEHGKKHAEYEESGKHSKGHSTKGSHDIHKKDEYEKNVEFFEEEGDSADESKHGGHNEERGHHKGGNYKKENHDGGYHDRVKGDSGHFNRAGNLHGFRDHKKTGSHDQHGKHGGDQFTKTTQNGGKKWIYHHGYPAKNANLVVIDRRADQLYHGPQYYG